MRIPEGIPWKSTGITLGSGGQGEVQLVCKRDQAEGPKYALKILRNTRSIQARERFRREIEVVKQLGAPAIAQVIDHSTEEDDFQYYVMEYHEGAKTLDSIMLSGDNPYHGDIMRSLDLFESIVSTIGVCETSSPQIVHRDINPKNILVLPDDSVRLIDFGVCQINEGEMITLVDENVGARNYTSPECEAGNDDSIGVHSDIYSAGKVLWAAITSRQAFAREEPVFRDRSMEKMFPAQPETWHLAYIFEKTVRRSPADRYRSTGDILQLTRQVRYVVQRGFPPLKGITPRCPSCGWQTIRDFQEGYQVFGNPNPAGVRSLICDLCGFGFVRNVDILQRNIERLEGLS